MLQDAPVIVRSRRFKALMTTFPSGVAVITTTGLDGTPLGLTCTSVCSVSLEPPLLLVCIDNRSHTLSTIVDRGMFAVNLLHEGGRDAAGAFAANVPDRFAGISWQSTPHLELPCLPVDAHAVAECRVHASFLSGDHTIVVGEVAAVERLGPGRPLMYGLRHYEVWPARAYE